MRNMPSGPLLMINSDTSRFIGTGPGEVMLPDGRSSFKQSLILSSLIWNKYEIAVEEIIKTVYTMKIINNNKKIIFPHRQKTVDSSEQINSIKTLNILRNDLIQHLLQNNLNSGLSRKLYDHIRLQLNLHVVILVNLFLY